MQSIPKLAVLLLACLAAPCLRADELRLADGRVLVGAVTDNGDTLEIRTRKGTVTVRAQDVVARRTEAELKTELKRLARGRKNDAFSHLQLARTALGWGLTRDLWKHLDKAWKALEREPSEALERRMREFSATLEPEVLPNGDELQETRARVEGMVKRVRPGVGRAFEEAALELLVREPNADKALRRTARRGLLDGQRSLSVAALLRRPAEGNDAFAYRTVILDKDPRVRERAAELIASHGDPGVAVRYLAPGLLHDAPSVRMRTAKAYERIGDPSALPVLVFAGPLAGVPRAAANGGIGVRAHMSALNQRSYIRDFDVEIAQAAAVANPVVGVLQDGVVLDAKVAAVVTHQVQIAMSYRRALKRLAADPGPDPKAWHGWLHDRDPEAAEQVTRWQVGASR